MDRAKKVKAVQSIQNLDWITFNISSNGTIIVVCM